MTTRPQALVVCGLHRTKAAAFHASHHHQAFCLPSVGWGRSTRFLTRFACTGSCVGWANASPFSPRPVGTSGFAQPGDMEQLRRLGRRTGVLTRGRGCRAAQWRPAELRRARLSGLCPHQPRQACVLVSKSGVSGGGQNVVQGKEWRCPLTVLTCGHLRPVAAGGVGSMSVSTCSGGSRQWGGMSGSHPRRSNARSVCWRAAGKAALHPVVVRHCGEASCC